jgi:hypothetical protein
MKKFIITGAALVALAVPSVASAEYGTQPGFTQAQQVSCNSGHGAFGAFGEHSDRHDLGQGDTAGDGVLGASPLTGPYQKIAAETCKTLR